MRRENWRSIDLKRRDGKLHQNLRTIPTQCLDFDHLSEQRTFAGFQIMSQPLSMSLSNFRGDNQFGQLLANRFSTRKAEYSFRRRVEFEHVPGRVHHNDAIERRIEEGAIEHRQLCSWIAHFVLLLLLRRHWESRLVKCYK